MVIRKPSRPLPRPRQKELSRTKIHIRGARRHAGTTRHLKKSVDPEITFGGRRRPDGIGLVREEHVGCGTIGIGVDRDRADSELSASANDADRDFSAVGDEDGVHSGKGSRRREAA
jgi:hypothetical protein